MKNLPLIALVFCLVATPVVFAKRSPPVRVTAVRQDTVEYRVPHENMGCVEAWDIASNNMIWRKQIYVVRYDVELEKDVQDIYITSVTAEKGKIVIKNERNSEYSLDLETLQATVIKGTLVERTSVKR